MGFSWTPITECFGAEIHDLDISRPIRADDQAELRALWREKGLLLFRRTPLDPAMQVALTEVFGEPEVHPAREAWVDGWPQLTNIRYAPELRDDTLIYEVGGRELANWQPWHIDTIYTEKIDRGGLLYAVEVPPEGADTGFLDRATVYDRMPEALRERAQDLRVLYRLNPIASRNPHYPESTARVTHIPDRVAALQARIATDFPTVSHPVFFTHPDSGRRTFNVTATHAVAIEGMESSEGDALLRELIAFSLSANERYYHKWQQHDAVLWDNWRFLHSAEGTPTDVTRRLRRSGVVGDYGHGRPARRETVTAAPL